MSEPMTEAAPHMPAFLDVEQSVSGRLWTLREANERTAEGLSQILNIPLVMGRVLAARGVTMEQAEQFLNPSLKHFMPDPSSFKEMDKAAERIAQAIEAGEVIAIFGDYDVDGATSSALLKLYLEAVGGKTLVYIPDRMAEGYGPNAPALLKLKEQGAAIAITVDCGITAYEPIAEATAAGLDMIIVDHHVAELTLPDAFAVVNPNRLDESGDFGYLAAVGVAFMLAVAVNRTLRHSGWFKGQRPEPNLMQWLDIVALGTVCDVVPLKGLNRALVRQGLKVMGTSRNCGLQALSEVCRIQEPPSTYHAGYLLGPRVNAGGRVGEASLGVRLLSTFDAQEAAQLAARLNQFNEERKAIEQTVEEEAIAQVDALREIPSVIVVASEGWHPGVIGIVAGRIKERYSRPTIVIALEDGVGKGSGRSISGVDLGAVIIAARQNEILQAGGGHKMAAGLTIDATRIEDFKAFIAARVQLTAETLKEAKAVRLDGALAVRGASNSLIETLEKAGPYGAGHSEPRFALTAVRIVRPTIVGRDHIRCTLQGQDGGRVNAIAFKVVDTPLGDVMLKSGDIQVHVAGSLRANHYRGAVTPQFTIEDIALA